MTDHDDTPDTPAAADAFERIYNPYVIGNPIRAGEPFFGREDDFAFAARRLEAEREGVVLLFVGGRRSGKTSIMFQVLDGRLGPSFLPVFIDMQQLAGIDGDHQMLGRMARIVIDSIGDERLVPDYYSFDEASNPILTFDRLLADINQIFPDKRLLFLVDEAELLRDKASRGEITSAVLTSLASALESRRVSYFFTGSSGLADADIAEWRRLMGKGDFREISFLSPTDTRRLATEPVDDRVEYADGVLQSIYQLTYGHPFYTQLICTNAVDQLNSHRRYRFDAGDLDEVVRTIVNNPPPQLVYDWDQFSHDEQLVLALLSEVSEAPHSPVPATALVAAVEENGYPIGLTSGEMNVLLDGLDAKMVLARSEEGDYHFLVDLVRLWIRRNRSVWRLVEEETPAVPRSRPRWTWAVGAAAVLVVAVIATAVLTRGRAEEELAAQAVPATPMGSLRIERFPLSTTVTVRGPLDRAGEPVTYRKSSTPDIIDALEAGRYQVVLANPLYQTRVETLAVAAGRRDTLRAMSLQRLQGHLTVTPTPPAAQVRVYSDHEGYDSTAAGRFEQVALNTGAYEVEARLAGFRTWSGPARVTAGEVTTLTPQLQADVGDLWVSSEPRGATVLLDGQELGVTPLRLPEQARGRHQLRLVLVEHLPWDSTASVRFGHTDSVHVRLEKQPATLQVRSTPPGARIWLDGAVLADTVTPERIVRPPGRYRLRMELAGYDAHEQDVELRPGASHQVASVLQQQFGSVRIARPAFGTLVIDGERFKEGPLGVRRLPVGVHRLQLEGNEQTFEVEVMKDSTITVKWE